MTHMLPLPRPPQSFRSGESPRALGLGSSRGLGLAAFRVRATSARLFTWTAVLYAALAMPMLGRMLPPLPVPTAFLRDFGYRRHREQAPAAQRLVPFAAVRSVTPSCGQHTQDNETVRPRPDHFPSQARHPINAPPRHPLFPVSPGWRSIRWTTVATGLYLTIALLLLALRSRARFSRRLIELAKDPRTGVAAIASHAHASGLAGFRELPNPN